MLNSIVLVGIKHSNTFVAENDDIHYARMILEIQRPYWNSDGSMQKDHVIVKVFRGVGDMLDEKYPIGSVIAIKGRIEETRDNLCIVIAEKLVYLNEEIDVG